MAWEYRIVANCSEMELNRLGRDGWELVALNGFQFIFKRPSRDRRLI